MKQTFASGTFRAKTFASGTWTGVGVTPPSAPPGGTWVEPARGLVWQEDSRGLIWAEEARGLIWIGGGMATKLVKRRQEFRTYVFDFSQLPEVANGDTLVGTPVVTPYLNSGPTGAGLPTVGTTAIASGNKTVTSILSGGTDGTLCTMECVANTAGGSTVVCVGLLDINEN